MQGEIDTLRAEVAGLKSKLDEDEPDEKPTKPPERSAEGNRLLHGCARLVYRWKNFAKDAENEGFPGCPGKPTRPRMCCMAMTAECMACSAGVSVEEFCKNSKHGRIAWLPKKTNETSYVLQRHECKMYGVLSWCIGGRILQSSKHGRLPGCPKKMPTKPRMCCRAMTAKCMACSAGVSVEEFCKHTTQSAWLLRPD